MLLVIKLTNLFLGTETIKRGASPPSDSTVRLKESTSNNSIKQPVNDQSSSSSSSTVLNKSIKDEIKVTESSSSGPNTSSTIQSYDKPNFSKPNLTTSASNITATSSNNYKHYSTINTTKSSPVDKFVRKSEISEASSTTSPSVTSKDDDITIYKPSYSLSSSSSNIPMKTVSVKTNGSKTATTVTNNFKLPPFPVYIPSTSLPSITSHLSSDSGLNSKSETSTTAFSSKYSDSPASSSVTTAYSTTLSRLSSSSSSPSRTINNVNTSTLPLHLGRNNPYSYQSESNFTNSNVTSTSATATANSNATTTSYSSPVTTSSYSNSNYNNVYSTLPKTTSSSYSSKYDSNNDNEKLSTSFSSYKYSTDYYSNLTSTTNNTSNNGTSTFTSSDSSNMYRVQYSATNPFLDPLDSSSTIDTDNISSLLRGNVAEAKKKFEKLDSEDDLK